MSVFPRSRFGLLLRVAMAVGACLAGPARSQSLVTSRSALAAADHLDWTVLGDHATRVSNPFSLISSRGTAVVVSQTGYGLGSQYGGAFATLRQAGTPQSEGALNGNFAPGDVLLDALDGGTVSLSFPNGVYGGGAQIAVPTPTASGAGVFTVQVQAFGKDGVLLASFTKSGTFSAKGDNSAPFLGIVDTSPDIYRIAYTGVTPHYSVFLNRFDIAPAQQAAPKSSHTHILWNNMDGRVMLWSIAQDGTFTLNGFGPYTDGTPQNKWSATALATGPDGLSHILWNNTDGRVMLWTVDDNGSFTLAGYGPYTDPGHSPATTITPATPWSAVSLSVGPDNVTHLLWTNPDGRVVLWNVDSAFHFTLAAFGPYTDGAPQNQWHATALATGPDNITRLVWNNTDYRVMLWKVDSSFHFTLAGYGPYTDSAPQNLWSAVGVSVGPDNLTHLLWSNTDRRAMFWNVSADFSFTLAGYGPYTDNVPQNLWSATAVATGPDSLSHILWDNTDYRAMLWGVDNAFSFTVAGYGPYTDGAPQNLWSATAVSAGP